MQTPKPISGFPENLPQRQMIEDEFKKRIRKAYSLAGFVSLDTPSVERVEALTSKGADDNEIYAIKRLKAQGDEKANFELGLRFDLTVPLARYVAMYESDLTFPFKRQQIGKSWRGERPQKGRYREFYQADIDIIGNGNIDILADVEVLETIYNALRSLDFGDFCININNKKFLSGFLETLGVTDIIKTISIIDKKDKVSREKLISMFEEIGLSKEQISKILELIDFSEKKGVSNKDILSYYDSFSKSEQLKEGLGELKYTYESLLDLGVPEKSLKLNPVISRGLNYYTGLVFETFIEGYENMGSISSGGRYENLASNFTKSSFPGVGGSIGLSRLLAVLDEIGKLNPKKQSPTEVLVLVLDSKYLKEYLKIVSKLRGAKISTEIYLSDSAKMQKQFKYAENKKIPFAIIAGEDEFKKGVLALKDLEKREQTEASLKDIIQIIKNKNV